MSNETNKMGWILSHRGKRWVFPTHFIASKFAARKWMLFYSINYGEV